MKHKRSTLALAVPLALLLAPVAHATPMFSLLWQDTGTSSISVSTTTSQKIVADLVFELEAGDTFGLLVGTFLYDEDLADELDFVAFRENTFTGLAPGMTHGPFLIGPFVPPSSNVPQESSLASAGLVPGFDVIPIFPLPPGPLPPVLGPLTITLGTVSFQTNASRIATDGIDLRFDVLPNGIDAYGFGDFSVCGPNPCPFSFPGASVNAPEPTTATLLVAGLALGAFVEARRRR